MPDPRATHRAPKMWPLAWIAALAGGAAIALSLVAHRVPYFAADLAITRSVQATDYGPLAGPMHALNLLGFAPVVAWVYGGLILAIFFAGRRWAATMCGLTVLGGAGINFIAKALVDRPRPPAELIHVERQIASGSFPAGHVLNFTAFAGFLGYVAWMALPPSWPRHALVPIVSAPILLMGVARIASGQHWPSDVLGGYLMGSAWLAVTIALYRWGRERFARATPQRPPGTLQPATVPLTRLALALVPFAIPLCVLGGLAATAIAAPADSTASTDNLAANWQAPWNPEHALAPRKSWEQVVLFPGRIVSLPLVGLGFVTGQTLEYLETTGRVSIGPTGPNVRKPGLISARLADLGDRTGLGGAVVGQFEPLRPLHTRIRVEYAATRKMYNRTSVAWSGQPLALQYRYEWRPQERYYGLGTASSKDSASDYAMQQEFVRVNARWAWGSDPASARPRAVFSAWAGPRSELTTHGRESHQFSTPELFPDLLPQTFDRRIEHLVYGASGLLDHRAGGPHWSHGWRLLASAEQYARPVRALALHSAAVEGATFTRCQLEAETGVSFMRSPRTLRLLVHVTDQQVTAGADRFLVSDLASLGGGPGLAGYVPGRFHGMDLLLTRVSYVFPLVERLEMDVHSEWGSVYSNVWQDATLRSLHSSIGFALRSRNLHVPRGALGFDFSREDIRLRFSLGAVE